MKQTMLFLIRALTTAVLLASTQGVLANDGFITVASTTSTENSGLFDALLPRFEEQSGFQVRVVAVGTGKAIRMAETGDADVLLVHHKPSEERFVAEGFGVARYDVMYNDFVLVGPDSDPAQVAGKGIGQALRSIAATESIFVSRGDDSGTHKKELSLWRGAELAPSGSWYRETGSGMGATLNVASGTNGYTLTDRATWLRFGNREGMKILVEGDPVLFNQYGVILVNPDRHNHVKAVKGQAFVDWLLSTDGQSAINAYRLEGQQAFFANARK